MKVSTLLTFEGEGLAMNETNHDLKKTPLHEEHIALGAKMLPFAGYEMPIQYAGILEEHAATRGKVGIFDVSHMATFRISGKEARDFLQRMLSNDIAKIDEIGAAQYTLLLDGQGHIIDDLIVYNTGGEYLIIANASNRATDFAWLSEQCPEGLVLADESEKTALIAVQGPEALSVVSELAAGEWEAPKRFHIAPITFEGGVNALAARTGYTGEDGLELVVHKDDAPALWRALLSFEQVTPVGLGARDTLRLEMGYHLYGSDMDRSNNPIEAGLGWVCPKAKEDYMGSEAVKEAREKGVDQKLVHLLVTGGVPRPGYPVYADNQQIAVIASGSHSPTLCTGIATAYVPVKYSTEGTRLQVHIRKRIGEATVVKPPFLDKK